MAAFLRLRPRHVLLRRRLLTLVRRLQPRLFQYQGRK